MVVRKGFWLTPMLWMFFVFDKENLDDFPQCKMMQVNSGFPHLIKTQQIQQSGTFTISCQLTVIMVNQN